MISSQQLAVQGALFGLAKTNMIYQVSGVFLAATATATREQGFVQPSEMLGSVPKFLF